MRATTKKPKTTTVDYFDLYFDMYESHMPKKDYLGYTDYLTEFLERDPLQFYYFFETLKLIYNIAAFVNLFVNLPHLFILLQKELRTNLVYIIMIGICICDLIHSISKIAELSMNWNLFYTTNNLIQGYPYFHLMTILLSKSFQISTRRCSAFLSLFIATFRSFSVIFPMSNAVNFMMKAKSGYLIVLFFFFVFGGWGSVYVFKTRIHNVKESPTGIMPSYEVYDAVYKEDWETTYRMIDGYMSIGISLAYLIVAVALIVALMAAEKRRKNLKKEKSNNTSMLVGFMAVTIFFSETVYGAIFIINFYFFAGFKEETYIEDFDNLALIFMIISSISHCFVCFVMSSQYREVVKRLLGIGKEKATKLAVVVESSAHPSTVQTTKTSNNSKKTF